MKFRTICYGFINNSQTINRFGNAWLIQMADRQFRLVGGGPDDLAAAEEWASFFAHEVVFSQSQIPKRAGDFRQRDLPACKVDFALKARHGIASRGGCVY